MSKILVILILLGLTGCSAFVTQDGPPAYDVDVSRIANAIPKVEPRSRRGNPVSYKALGQRYYVMKSNLGFHQRGIASWYGSKFHDAQTSSGESYDMYAMTAAHKRLPLPTYVRVTNLDNHRQIIVKVNDRGPFARNRIIDLSYVAAKKLGMLKKGTALVDIQAIDPHHPQTISRPRIATAPVQAHIHNPQLFLQIGAFTDAARAKQLRQRTRQLTTLPIRIRHVAQGKVRYQVQVGPMPSVASSDQLSDKLLRYGFAKPFVLIL